MARKPPSSSTMAAVRQSSSPRPPERSCRCRSRRTGEWVLSFHEGLGVISYVAEDDEPFYEDWAQNLLSHKAYKQGDTVFVVTASGERLVQGAYLSLHDQLHVGV